MLNSVPWYIGLRYIGSKRRNGFIAFVSLFAFLGMLLGVFALIVVLSVMNGFDAELKQRILRVVPHASLSRDGALEDWAALAARVENSADLLGSAPFVEGKALLAFDSVVRPIQLQGIDPAAEAAVSDIGNSMLIGDIQQLQGGDYGIVLGALLARSLGVSTGDKVAVTLPLVSVTPAGVFPRSKRFTVVGVFEVGAQVDQHLAMIHLRDAQRLFRLGDAVQGLRLRFTDIYAAPARAKALEAQLGGAFHSRDWSQTQGSLFQAVKMEKTVVGLMLSVIIAVAAFNIVTSLIMMVTEKRGDIAVLRTLGLSRWGVMKIFVVQGTCMGLIGIAVGTALGVITAQHLSGIMAALQSLTGVQLFDPEVYFVAYLPSLWRLDDTLLTCGFAVVIAFLATLYPAYRASGIEPAEALRYDT